MPLKCTHCGIFGHGDKTCSRKTTPGSGKVWMPKKVDQVEIVQDGEKVNNSEEASRHQQTKGKEKESEGKASTPQASSTNRFSLLEPETEKSEPPLSDRGESTEAVKVVETRKPRVAAAGVADLMKTFKPRKKKQPTKVKKKQIGPILEGQSSLTST